MNAVSPPVQDAQRAPTGFHRVWAFVWSTFLLIAVVSITSAQTRAAQDLAQAGCVTAQMSVSERAAVKQLSADVCPVVFAQMPLPRLQ